MPRPEYLPAEFNPFDAPDTRLEVLGKGRKSRGSKTNIPDVDGATILQRIGCMATDLAEILRKLHAHHYTRTVKKKRDDGTEVEVQEPEILTYEELRDRYSCIKAWEEGHRNQLDNLVSVKGFSITATMGRDEAPRLSRKEESSAGSDSGPKDVRWKS